MAELKECHADGLRVCVEDAKTAIYAKDLEESRGKEIQLKAKEQKQIEEIRRLSMLVEQKRQKEEQLMKEAEDMRLKLEEERKRKVEQMRMEAAEKAEEERRRWAREEIEKAEKRRLEVEQRKREEEKERQALQFQQTIKNMHHLVSTKSRAGVYNAPTLARAGQRPTWKDGRALEEHLHDLKHTRQPAARAAAAATIGRDDGSGTSTVGGAV